MRLWKVCAPGPLIAGLAIAMYAPLDGQSIYNFGNPDADEQHYIELINRARANPPAEGARLAVTTDPDVLTAYSFYHVDLAMMQSEFNALPPLPPLAPNANLTAAARGHSAWMLAHATQSHNQTNPPNTPHDRILAAGYVPLTTGENIFAYSENSWHGHAGFQVDWGIGGTGGMQVGRGHRMSIHSEDFREIGVGIVRGTNNGVGPQVVTENFGAPLSGAFFATGVAYYDLNNNNFYDGGEGISGLSVNVQGAAMSCITASGGGWAVPIPNAAATRTITFSGLGLSRSVNLSVPAASNAKADLKLPYSPPQITSSATPPHSVPHQLVFTPVGGATAYRWNRWTLTAASSENCENTDSVTASTTGSYSVLNSTIKQQGTSSFHLENSTANSQSLELKGLYYGGSSPSLSFQSRIRTSTPTEKFKLQVAAEGTNVWQDVDTQTGGTPQSAFVLRTSAIPTMAGKLFRVRFLLEFTGGGYFPHSGDDFGWFIDAISFSGISTADSFATQVLSTTTASFTPSPGSHLWCVAPVISGIEFPAAYQILTVAGAPLSSDATLAGLSLSAGTLSPSFSAATTRYTARVKNRVSALTITPTKTHAAARVSLNGTALGSGTTSLKFPLAVGNNSFSILVTAQNGTTRTYSLTVTRAPSSDARLTALKIKGIPILPQFKPNTRFYQASPPTFLRSVRVVAKTSSREARLKINGQSALSGKPSKPIKIKAKSDTIIQVVVTAGNGSLKKYQVVLKRRKSTTTTAD